MLFLTFLKFPLHGNLSKLLGLCNFWANMDLELHTQYLKKHLRLIYEKFVWTPKIVWTHQNACSLPELVFGEKMHINYNNTYKQSYYRLRTIKSRENLDLLLYGEMIFIISKRGALQVITLIVMIIIITKINIELEVSGVLFLV